MAPQNSCVVLNERPTEAIIPEQTLKLKTGPAPKVEDLKDGEAYLEVLYLSLDPAMRGWMSSNRSYLPPVEIGAIMRGYGVARVLASKTSKAKVGDIVFGSTGWTELAILNEKDIEPQSSFPGLKRPMDMISTMGMTGVTAWIGMKTIGEPKAGETVVVSAAAGATGSVAGQIAKIAGARVIGTAGSDEKCKWLTDDLGFDVALNYKAPDFEDKFKEATKDFIDVYFDNVGGRTLELALLQAKKNARFVECGLISQYNDSFKGGPNNFGRVIGMRIKMQGFIVLDHEDRYAEARAELGQWVSDGKMKSTETVLKGGIAAAQEGLVNLYKGINQGKLMVEVKNPDESPTQL